MYESPISQHESGGDQSLIQNKNRLYHKLFCDATIAPMSANKGPRDRRPTGAAFLLAQVGAHGSRRFAERVAELGLTAPDAGLLRKVASDPGVSQQALAEHLSVMPSRMVALVDDLETKGIIERRRSTEDRRNYALHLTERGRQVLDELARVAAAHEESLCAALNEEERTLLRDLLRRIADEQGLTPGVHPGYRQLGRKR
jgi:DNA-binding MarR family transcriptional regulator